jgi:microcystin-dependent protein
MASSKSGAGNTPGSTVALANNAQTAVNMYGTVAPNTTLSGSSISNAGNSLPHENRQPLVTINYIIALEGVYPSQN